MFYLILTAIGYLLLVTLKLNNIRTCFDGVRPLCILTGLAVAVQESSGGAWV